MTSPQKENYPKTDKSKNRTSSLFGSLVFPKSDSRADDIVEDLANKKDFKEVSDCIRQLSSKKLRKEVYTRVLVEKLEAGEFNLAAELYSDYKSCGIRDIFVRDAISRDARLEKAIIKALDSLEKKYGNIKEPEEVREKYDYLKSIFSKYPIHNSLAIKAWCLSYNITHLRTSDALDVLAGLEKGKFARYLKTSEKFKDALRSCFMEAKSGTSRLDDVLSVIKSAGLKNLLNDFLNDENFVKNAPENVILLLRKNMES